MRIVKKSDPREASKSPCSLTREMFEDEESYMNLQIRSIERKGDRRKDRRGESSSRERFQKVDELEIEDDYQERKELEKRLDKLKEKEKSKTNRVFEDEESYINLERCWNNTSSLRNRNVRMVKGSSPLRTNQVSKCDLKEGEEEHGEFNAEDKVVEEEEPNVTSSSFEGKINEENVLGGHRNISPSRTNQVRECDLKGGKEEYVELNKGGMVSDAEYDQDSEYSEDEYDSDEEDYDAPYTECALCFTPFVQYSKYCIDGCPLEALNNGAKS